MNRIVLVKSCQRFRNRQEAVLATWGRELRRAGVRVFLLTGGHRRPAIEDGLINTTGGDGYQDNIKKLRDGLRVVLGAIPGEFRVFVCDDDTFIHPERWLAHEPEDAEAMIYTPPRGARPCCEQHSWIAGGGGWWMTRRLCQLYADHARGNGSWDDVVATKIIRDAGVAIADRPDLYAQWSERLSPENSLITCHHVIPEEMRRLWDSLSVVCL